MKITWQYWLKQAGIGLVVVLVIAGLGHLNYTQWRLLPGWTMADWWFVWGFHVKVVTVERGSVLR
ncbi:hypothetical protein OE230_02770 [Levilactobacillus brevis]|nr:hypothetical protein OE230_02770 [Levilactobacillus brevis]